MCGNCEIVWPEKPEPMAKIESLLANAKPAFMEVTHTFKGGVYTRTGKIAAGEIIIGAKHRAKNILNIYKGKIAVWDNINGFRILTAPHSEISFPGIQRIGIGIEDVEGCNIFETEKTTVDEVENEMLYPFTLPLKTAETVKLLAEKANATI